MSDVAVVTLSAAVTSSAATKRWGTSLGSVYRQTRPGNRSYRLVINQNVRKKCVQHISSVKVKLDIQ